jgi:hypothetical protein
MNNEQFQMLMDLVGNASDGAFWLVIMFFSVEIIGMLLIVFTIIGLTVILSRLIHSTNIEHIAVLEIYHEVMGDHVGAGVYNKMDHRDVMDKIRSIRGG